MFENVKEVVSRPEVQKGWQGMTKTDRVNVNESERLGSIIVGMIKALYGLTRLSREGAIFVMSGSYLLYRGLTGHCFIYEWLDFSTASRTERLQFNSGANRDRGTDAQQTPEEVINSESAVDEVAWETFPASDPPAWTSSATG